MNTIGQIFRLTTFGESHGPAMGGIIDGCPSGCIIDLDQVGSDLARRQGDGTFTTARRESDQVEILSGIYQGRTTGTPLAFLIRNHNQRSEDYDRFKGLYRPGHGDFNTHYRFPDNDPRGGGRTSARETVSWVVAGSIARQILAQKHLPDIDIHAEVESVGGRPDYQVLLEEAHAKGDTLGGIVSCTISADSDSLCGIGEPVFDKLNARLASAMMSIPSAMGFEMGDGFHTASVWGSQYVDAFDDSQSGTIPTTVTNHCGGIQAGISNGMPIQFRVAFHPVVTLPQGITCINDSLEPVHIIPEGRHDLCQVLRTPVIVESLAALTLLDLKMLSL